MPLGSADVHPNLRAADLAIAEEAEAAKAADQTVTIYGASDDLIEIEGKVPGCNEYNREDGHFILTGERAQVRIRCWYTKRGLWAISGSQVAEGMEVLPVTITGGESQYSVRAVVEGVRLVVPEMDN